MKYESFHLVLMVTRACNLRCDYCYAGCKRSQPMDFAVGAKAIDRALASIFPSGKLELGFFGGEPLLEAERIEEWIRYAEDNARARQIRLWTGLTTNGTLFSEAARRLLLRPDLDVTISHDGLPEIHDRHRRTDQGGGTALKVLETIRGLQAARRDVRTLTVVHPDTLSSLVESIQWLRRQEVRHTDLTLDVWADWTAPDMVQLEQTLMRLADVWRDDLPACSINWFDEKAAHLLGCAVPTTARCRFGDGEIAVSPSGNLYPCERLIGEDGPDQPMRLPGHVSEGDDFCGESPPSRSTEPCDHCAIQQQCNTTCRCSNYLRTGDPTRPDALLCLLDRVCYRETARVLDWGPLSDLIFLSENAKS